MILLKRTKKSMFSFEGAEKCFNADVAQLAEQLTCNQQVNGSSPFIGFYFLTKVKK